MQMRFTGCVSSSRAVAVLAEVAGCGWPELAISLASADVSLKALPRGFHSISKCTVVWVQIMLQLVICIR